MGLLSSLFNKKSSDNIKQQLESIYVPMLQRQGLFLNEAIETFNELYLKAVQQAKDYGENFAGQIFLMERLDKNSIIQLRNDYVTDRDIKSWWNLHEYERRMVIQYDSYIRTIQYLSILENTQANTKEEAMDNAMNQFLKCNPTYYSLFDDSNSRSEFDKINPQDRPLPYELKDRINNYLIKLMSQGQPEKCIKDIESFSSFNAFIRHSLRQGNL